MAQHSIISGTTIRKDATYKFQVALSKDAYCNKQQVLAAISPKDEGRKLRKQNGVKQKMSFINVEVTAEQLLDYAINGYTFCTLHSGFPENNPLERKTYVKHDGSYTLTAKCDDYFSGSFFIGVDIDETQYKSPIDFIEKLRMKPTFWYTSFSNQQIENGENKGARFRMIYVFNQLIEDKFFFRYCSFKLHSLIELETEEEIHDKCGMLASQYFNGTNWNNKSLKIDFGISNAIYSLDDINCSYDDYYTFLCNDCYYKKNLTHKDKKEIEERKCILLSHNTNTNKQQTTFNSNRDKSIHSNTDIEKIRIDKRLIADAEKLRWDDFFKLYRNKYPYIYRTEKSEWLVFYSDEHGEIKYQECDESYFELKWPIRYAKNGERILISDGHHRRNTLFHRGWMRRIIDPNISPDILFYNLMVDRERFFDNNDGVLSVDVLVNKVEQCFLNSIDGYKQAYGEIYQDTL